MMSETLENDWYEDEGGYNFCGNHIEEDIGGEIFDSKALVFEEGEKRMGVYFEHLGGCVKDFGDQENRYCQPWLLQVSRYGMDLWRTAFVPY